MTPHIEILFEDAHYVVIDKPSGLVVHPDGRTEEHTLVDWILETHPEIKNVGESWTRADGRVVERPGIVHRLDRETSGVMVIAKTQASFEHLKRQFQEHNVEKEYRAFVYGRMPLGRGVIDRPIGKSAKDFRLRSAQRGARGYMRDAVTEYDALQSSDAASYVVVFPKTGRTHQIRVHFKAIHHPVVCDKLYAPKSTRQSMSGGHECILGFTRLALHAHKLSFVDEKGTRRAFESPLPLDFVEALGEMRGLEQP